MTNRRFDVHHAHQDPRLGPSHAKVSKSESHRMRQRHANDKAPHLSRKVSRWDPVKNWYRRGSGR